MVEVMKKVSEDYVKNAEVAREMYPGALVLDVTLGGGMGMMAPEYAVGGLAVPGRDEKALSILGMWEGLKVFKNRDVDPGFFSNEKKLGEVRKCKSYGKLVGVRKGNEILGFEEAVESVFKEAYREMIREKYPKIIEGLRKKSDERVVVLLDYPEEMRKSPCSHGEILKEMIEAA